MALENIQSIISDVKGRFGRLSDSSRKNFLIRVGMISGLVLSYGTGIIYALRFLVPKKTEARFRKLYVTSMDNLPKDHTLVFKDLKGREIVLVNTGAGIRAISTTCTHLGCKVHWEPEGKRFFCPCHLGVFDINGNVKSGPPPRPLDNFKVESDKNNNLFVYVNEI
jgi:nitrite reductase/ring-hydroxylating ferredoxin subunit